LNQKDAKPLTGAPAKATAKPRKPSRILREINQNTPSIQKRKTNQIRKAKRDHKNVCILYTFFLISLLIFIGNFYLIY
jgi:hypothetical protein